ncbi:cupin domain-containing protein [Rhodococcus sp. APC 3903]|uniref:cupin domain-containing protein n=1 Tax=Rhodococcus sp. APC 3903 TaxID=3035193 RepID=UPI0025B2BCF0|nr:cupin domain-containing protein [Rhodococcus sp. APC 3903]MDN3459879.1 cupin domain-containing protein [Rhodococcus sp. APC 3903]
MTTSLANTIETGSRNSTGEWVPFAWTEPVHGPQVKGEVLVIRTGGTSGSLQAGLWRTGVGIAGCNPDGTCHVDYSAPTADETVVILEGVVEVTVTSTGKKYELEAGSIMSHPKGLDITWDIKSPFLKKFWVLWDSPQEATKDGDVYVGNISDNPEEWAPYEWVEPEHGPQVCGELFALRGTGATGTLMCGLWRTGVGIAGCEADGSSIVPYTAPLGDETMLILEGRAHLVDHASGDEYDFKAGDIIALPSGLETTWTSRAPYVKKFWVITNENVPS